MTRPRPGARPKRTPEQNRALLVERIAALNSTLLGEYTVAHGRVAVQCWCGYVGTPQANQLIRGHTFCKRCAGMDPETAELAFRNRVKELGGVVIGPYVKADMPVEVICAEGHTCRPRPGSVNAGQGLCKTCAGQDSSVAEANFRGRITDLGGTVVGAYSNAHTPVHVRCREGHDAYPRPNTVRNGQGICATCVHGRPDVLYLVRNPETGAVKFGVTTGDERPRLRDHRRAGYVEVLRLHTQLSGNVAGEIERLIKRTLRAKGFTSLNNSREYFPAEALDAILEIFCNHPGLKI